MLFYKLTKQTYRHLNKTRLGLVKVKCLSNKYKQNASKQWKPIVSNAANSRAHFGRNTSGYVTLQRNQRSFLFTNVIILKSFNL